MKASKVPALTAALMIVGLSGPAFASVGNFPQQQPPPRASVAASQTPLAALGNRPQHDAARSQVKIFKAADDAVRQR